jgi:hypothetical protein
MLDVLMARIENLVTDAKNHATVSNLVPEFSARLTEIVNQALGVKPKRRPGRPRTRKGSDRPEARA